MLARGTTLAPSFAHSLACKTELQNRLFTALSAMFGREVPLYDKALRVNMVCNTRVCALMSQLHIGFTIDQSDLERASGERHGAIRIGRADEYHWMGRLFACFAMEPHCFYDMTAIGAKSQPVIATAFRSRHRPEHRVFTSLLMTDYFDADTRARIETLLAQRETFSPRAKELIERSERDDGLSPDDAQALINECTQHIFKWTGRARDFALYNHLCAHGFKIAADIACFQSHHLNHLTPNTLCMDLYTAAIKHCLGEVDAHWFRARTMRALTALVARADHDFMKLHFKHVPLEEIARYRAGVVTNAQIAQCADELVAEFALPEFALFELDHAGCKESTEGPSADTAIFLRQDAYKALTEPVQFTEADGAVIDATHTARFGEIEERGYACTPKGRAAYDACLAQTELLGAAPGTTDERMADEAESAAFEARYADEFAAFEKSLPGLIAQRFVYARYVATDAGIAAKERGAVDSIDLPTLIAQGFVAYEGLRYEDFLPVSAAGIFASNLNQYGTKSSAAEKPTYSQSQLEAVLGRRIIDATLIYAAMEAQSKLDTFTQLGVIEMLSDEECSQLQRVAASS